MTQSDTIQTQERSSVTRLLAQLVVSGVVITALAGSIFLVVGNSRGKAIDAKKQLELSRLHLVLVEYYISEGVTPINHSTEESCVIGAFYDNKKCLRELSRDGYGAPPVSPDEHPYTYYDDEEIFYVATELSEELSPDKRCPHQKNPHTWCKVYKK